MLKSIVAQARVPHHEASESVSMDPFGPFFALLLLLWMCYLGRLPFCWLMAE